jgi:hypothetical protein
MFRSGRRLFSTASIALIVVAILHSIGSFAPGPVDPALESLVSEMKAFRLPLGLGMRPSMFDIHQSLALTMSVMLLWLGLQNLTAARSDPTGSFVRLLNVFSVLGVGALVALYAFYRIPPPFISLAVVELLFVLALATSSRSAPAAAG